MILLRKILFFVFLGVYLFLCPLVILYSLGYIYAPKTEEGIIKTGLIHLESLPAGASVSLNGKILPERTPCTISGLLTGQYRVRVQLKGHRVWNEAIDVQPGKASVFEKIMLLPEKLESKVLIPQPFQTLIPVPSTRYLLLCAGKSLGDVTVFDWKNGEFRQLVADPSPYAGEEVGRFFLAKGSPYALFEVQANGKSRYLWSNLREGEFEARDISELFRQGKPDDVQWEGGNPDYLFASRQGNLSRLDLHKKTVSSALMDQLRGYGLHKGNLYGFKEASLVRMDSDADKGEERTIEGGSFWKGLFQNDGSFRLDFFQGDTVFFIGERGQLISNLLPYRFMEKGLVGYSPDVSSKKILVWTRQELGIFDLEKTHRREALFERGPAIDWIWGAGGEIRQAYLAYGDSHILFCDENSIRLLEVGIQPPVPQEIVSVREKSVPFYSDRTGKLYYLEPQKGYFTTLQIIPEERLLERMFGEIEQQKPQEEL